MAWLAGTGNLKKKFKHGAASTAAVSSDEYEESDEEPKVEIFQVRKIVNHFRLNKGAVRAQTRGLTHVADPDALERSKIPYAFKVRWRGYGEEEDTWEPIENFNSAMKKKLSKYCKKHGIKLPEGFHEWLLPVSEDDTSGSDQSDCESTGKKKGTSVERNTAAASTPTTSRPKTDEKRLKQLREDLALSPSPAPSPHTNKKPEKKFDPLFDFSDDETFDKKQESGRKPLGTPNGTPRTEAKKKGKTSREGSIDETEKRRKMVAKKKKEAEGEKKNSGDGIGHTEEEEKRKKKERAALEKQAAEHAKTLVEEEKRRKERKAAKMEKEKERPAEPHKPKKVGVTSPHMMHDEMMVSDDEFSKTGDKDRAQKSTERGQERRSSFSDALFGPSATSPTKAQKLSELEMKNKKRKLEEKKNEKCGDKAERKKERRKENEVEMEGARPLSNFRIPKIDVTREKERVERENEMEEEQMEMENESEEESESEDDEPEMPLDPEARLLKAKSRLQVIEQRLADFADQEDEKERQRWWVWGQEEERWRKKMYESKKWIKSDNIRDIPFDIRADQKQAKMTHVRTLRRCSSNERMPRSFLRLSSIHSLESVASEAESLAAALTEIQIGDTAERLRQIQERTAQKKRKEEQKEKAKAVQMPDTHDLSSKMEVFARETLAMTEELMPGKVPEETIRQMCKEAVSYFLSLNQLKLIPLLETINLSECINRTILRLVRIYSPIINLMERAEGCSENCDDGEHMKCRMLQTLLLALSDPLRMGDGEECLLPFNALYDALEVSAPCQIRALIRGGCTFDEYYDDEGKNAAHLMMEKWSILKLVWLIERGLDVNSPILPKTEKDLESETYDRPWKFVKESNEKAAFVSQMHSQRLTARSLAWTRTVDGVRDFNLRPLTLVHTLNPQAYYHRFTAVTLCDDERKGFDLNDVVLLAVHSAFVRQGRGLRPVVRKSKKVGPDLSVPYFLIDRASDDPAFTEKYECTRARLTTHNLDRPAASTTVELTRLGSNGPTTVYKVPKQQAQYLVSGRRYTECFLKCISPPEYSVLLAQYFIVPFKTASGKIID